MALSCEIGDDTRATRPARPWLLPWGVGLVGLLVAEMFLVSYQFDEQHLWVDGRWWVTLFAALRWVPRVLVAVAAALGLFWGGRLRAEYERFILESDSKVGSWPFVAGHLAAFAAFFSITGRVWEGDLRAMPHASAWVAGWLALGSLTLALWFAAVLPLRLWRPVAFRLAWVALAGLAIGVASCGMGYCTAVLWRPMGRSTLWVVHALLRLVFRDTVYVPASFVVGTPTFVVHIAPECSGYEGIGLIWVFFGVFLVLNRDLLRLPHALVLLPLGTVVVWFSNAVRIAALVAVGTLGSARVATGGFHSQAGWLAFNVVALGLVALAARWRWVAAPGTAAEVSLEPPAGGRTLAYLAPLLTIVAVTMVTAAFSNGFDLYYPLRVVAAFIALWLCWRGRVAWSWSWTAVAIGGAVFALWIVLEPRSATPPSETTLARGLAGLSRGAAITWLAFRVIGSAVAVPIAEELAFRGYLTRRLIDADFERPPAGAFSWPSFLISSAVFGAMHGRWLAGTLAGMLYALALYRRGKLSDAVLAHATTNALIALDVLSTGNWTLWS